jgi:hypothetical protein
MPEFYAHSLEGRPDADWQPMRQHGQKTTHVCRHVALPESVVGYGVPWSLGARRRSTR